MTKFAPTMLFGNLMILANIIVVVIFLAVKVSEDGLGPNIEPINKAEYWTMIGFSCYCYEGIGMILPVMNLCECPEKFDKIMLGVFILLTTIYCFFSNFCYLAIGSDMTEPFVIQ